MKRYPPVQEQVRLAYEECERKGRWLLISVLTNMLLLVVVIGLVVSRFP